MNRKTLFLSIAAAALAAASCLSLLGTGRAFAQEGVSAPDSSCVGCHEDQYHLYDRGKAYCLCQSPLSCSDCHAGRTGTLVEESAHEGLIANPLVEDAAVCQRCHPADYREKVGKFASIAGVSATPVPYATCTPSVLIAQTTDGANEVRILRALPAGPWQALGLALLGLVSLVVFLFGCRCWKTDELTKAK